MKKIIAGIAVLIAVITAFILFDIPKLLIQTLQWIDALGTAGILIFIALYIVGSVLFFPGSILTLGAGVLFGVLYGTAIVSVASILGATAAFLVGRYLARDWVQHKIIKNKKFKAIDDAVGNEGWKIVGLTRLSPIFPFTLQNYAYGLTKVSLKHYFFASWIAMLPGTLMYVYVGSLAGNLVTLGTESQGRTPMEWGFYIFGLLATVVVTVYVTKIARKALAQRIHE